MDTGSGIPWGLTRVTARLPMATPLGRAELDPVTQTARYFDEHGQVIEMGRHGTNKQTSTTSYSGGSGGTDGQGPKPQVSDDSTTDYEPD